MQVFKTALRIIRTKKSILIYVLMPIVMTMVYMASSPKLSSSFSEKPVSFVVENFDQSNPLSQALVDVMTHNNTLVEYPTDPLVLRNKLFYMEIQYALTIPKNFFEDYAAYIAAGADSKLAAPHLMQIESAASESRQMNQVVERFLTVTAAKLTANPTQDKNVLATALVKDLTQSTEVHVVKSVQDWNTGPTDFFFRFSSYGIMSTLIFVSGFIYLAFRNKKVLSRQLASPTSYSQLNFGIGMSQLMCALALIVLYTLAALQYFGKTMFSTVGLLALANLAIFTLVILSLSIFISTIMRTESSVMVIGNVIPLTLSFFGGSFIPMQYLSKSVQQIANFLPSYWYTKSLDEFAKLSSTDMSSLTPIYTNFLVLAAFGVTFAIASFGLSHFLNRSSGENLGVAKAYG